MLAVGDIAQITVGAVIESTHPAGEIVGQFGGMACLYTAQRMRAASYVDARALCMHGVGRVHTYQTAFGVDTVQGALRATQDVYTLQTVAVMVLGTTAHQRDLVQVYAHGRASASRSHSPYVHTARIARSVLGHNKRGNVCRKRTEVCGTDSTEVGSRKHIAANGLTAKKKRLFGLRHDDDFIEVYHTGCVGNPCHVNRQFVGIRGRGYHCKRYQ